MNTHHAQVVRVASPLQSDATSFIEGEEVTYQAERLGIDDVRACTLMAARRPREQQVQTLVIRTEFITLESQHAMLKLLEEPPETTRLLLLIPPDLVLLPTILSRISEVIVAESASKDNTEFMSFQSATYKERLTMIDVAAKKKDSAWYRAIKNGLIQLLGTKGVADSSLEYVARTLLTRGASNKMLLEQAALSLPAQS